MIAIDKALVVAALRAKAQAELEAIEASQQQTQKGATHEEARSEHDKDTRATESSYLARGLAKRVAELRDVVTAFDLLDARKFADDQPIALSALVCVQHEDESESHYFVARKGGGLTVTIDGTTVTVITPEAPLGRSLVGKHLDDDVALKTPQGLRELTVVGLA